MTRPPIKFDQEKFWGLARYILCRKPLLGPDALFALMFLIDMDAYRQQGEPVTGATWTKQPDVHEDWDAPMTAQAWPA